MFPSIDNDVIAAILAQHNDDTEAATNDLLQLTNDSGKPSISHENYFFLKKKNIFHYFHVIHWYRIHL